MPEQKKSLEQLRMEVARLKKMRGKADERKRLEKQLKFMKFEKTKLGKVAVGLTKVGLKLTQPPKRTPEGKVVKGTGGAVSRLMQKLGEKKAPVSGARRVPVTQRMTSVEGQLSSFSGMGSIPHPARKVIAKTKKKATARPMSVKELLANMPE